MILKPSNRAFLILLVGACCFGTVNAQEGRLDSEAASVREPAKTDGDGGSVTFEAESKTSPKPTVAPVKESTRDSIQVKTSIKPVKTPEKPQKEEDPLSFNFLYYIIEKFKLSDMIE
jgi:hypothetical protein